MLFAPRNPWSAQLWVFEYAARLSDEWAQMVRACALPAAGEGEPGRPAEWPEIPDRDAAVTPVLQVSTQSLMAFDGLFAWRWAGGLEVTLCCRASAARPRFESIPPDRGEVTLPVLVEERPAVGWGDRWRRTFRPPVGPALPGVPARKLLSHTKAWLRGRLLGR